MQDLPFFVKHKFFKFLNNEESIDNFEKWSYESNILAEILYQEDYLDLISLDFSRSNTKYEVLKIICKYTTTSEYELWKLKNILIDFIDRNKNHQDLLFEFYKLYCNGYSFLDNLGLKYGLSAIEITSPDRYGKKLSIEEQNQSIYALLPAATIEAQKVLTWLVTGKIEIIKQDECDRGLFIDRRTETDK